MKQLSKFTLAALVALLLGIGISNAATTLFPPKAAPAHQSLPKAGQVLIGNSTGTYTPAYLRAGSNITIATSSGAITISASGGGGGGGSASGTVGLIQYSDGSGGFDASDFLSWDSGLRKLNLNTANLVFLEGADQVGTISNGGNSFLVQASDSVDDISDGKNLILKSGNGGVTYGNAGDIFIRPGQALGGDSNGGSVAIESGAGAGAGSNGVVRIFTGGSGSALLDTSLLSTDRTFYFPDSSGTLCLTTTCTGGGSTTTINGVLGNGFVFNITGNPGLSYSTSTGIISLTQATSTDSVSGFLSAADHAIFNAKQATITGGATTITTADLTANRALISTGLGKVAVSTTTATELGYLNGVTSAIQTQIDSKQATITGGATTITSSNLTASRALISNASGKVAVSTTTDTELGYVNGVTSAIQTQLNGKEASISAGTTAQYWRGDKSFQTLNQAAVAGLTTTDSPTFTGVSVTNATSSGTLGVPKDKTLAISGQVSVNSSSAASSASTLKFHDGTAERVLNPEKCFAPAWVIENPTATEDIPILVFNNTSTITKVKAVNKTTGDTVTFNLGYGPSRATATSTLPKLFSSNQTVTATTTISSLTINSSSTPNNGDILRFYTTAASTSQLTLDVCYRENS